MLDVDAQLERYLDELYLWNTRIRLTSVPRAEAQARHIQESRELLDIVAPPPRAAVVDVGSGGGVPGIVIAVVRSDLDVSLIEADRRKAAFLTHLCGVLELHNVHVVPERAEVVAHAADHREQADIGFARAVAAPAALCELALPLIRVGGALFALVSDAAAAAVESANAAGLCGGEPSVAAPGVLRVDKRTPTPAQFPRRAGMPGKRPLTQPSRP